MCREKTRELEYAGSAGSVVVSAVMNLAGSRREAAAAFAASSEVIVMRADDDDFLLENRIGAFEHTGDVVSRNFAPHDVGGEQE